jgi:hypothetical protein
MITISELKAAAEVISKYCEQLWGTIPMNADGIYENAPCEKCAFYSSCLRRLPCEWEFPEDSKKSAIKGK